MAQKQSTDKFLANALFNVSDYVCLITGGGSGIGLMAAQALSANGAKVYITGRRKEVLENAAKTHSPTSGKGQIIAATTCDVTKKEDLDKLYKEISSKEKYLTLLITASGISGTKAQPEETDAEKLKKTLWEAETFEAWGETYATDVSAVYFTTVAFLPMLQAASKAKGHMVGNAIVLSSMSGQIRHAQGHFSYNAAKAATIGITKLMSGEFSKAGIRINSIAPGYFPSEMTAKESDEDQKSHLPAEKILEKGHVPQQRAGSDAEMGAAVIFLASNAYVQGHILNVDGGVLNELSS